MPSQIPDPFYVGIIEKLSAVQSELINLRAEIKKLAPRNEILLHRWVLGGFFIALLSLAIAIIDGRWLIK